MRHYLFKGFHITRCGKEEIFLNGQQFRGEWVQGYYVACKDEYCSDVNHAIFTPGCEHVCMGEYTDFGWYNVIPDTVCQSTGLYDEDGNMIWENDIASVRDNLGGFTEQIVWNETFAQFMFKDTIFPLGDFAPCERKVVGNIFQITY